MPAPRGEAKPKAGARTIHLCYCAHMLRCLPCPALLLAVGLTACHVAPDGGEAESNMQETAQPKVVVPSVAEPLMRRDLLMAVAQAASDHALAVDDRNGQRILAGRPFSFRIRYCNADPDESAFRRAFDPLKGVLRVSARPDLDLTDPQIGAIAKGQSESVKGVWIVRPWMLEAGCPRPNGSLGLETPQNDDKELPQTHEEGPPPPRPIVGIAQFFDDQSTGPLQRDGRAFEATHRVDPASAEAPVDLVLEGRLKDRDGRSIACTGGNARTPPTCVISVAVDRIRLEQAGGILLGEWSAS